MGSLEGLNLFIIGTYDWCRQFYDLLRTEKCQKKSRLEGILKAINIININFFKTVKNKTLLKLKIAPITFKCK